MKPSVDVDELLGKARLIVRARTPYFRSALVALVPKVVEGLGTIGVTERGVLMYDPAFLARFPADVVAGLLVHEVLHVLHRHTTGRCGHRDPTLFNLAGDLSINPSILEMGFKLPEGENRGMFPKDLGWPEGETAEQYYNRLIQEAAKQLVQAAKGKGCQCGSGAGNPFDQEPKREGGKGGTAPEDGPGDYDGRTEAQIARVAQQVAQAVEDHARQKGRGSVPSGLERWAKDALAPPKVPWRQLLARALRSEVAYRAGAVVHRYDGPSRRQAGIGYGEGKPVLPRLRQPVPRVAVVVDTSGSMSEGELGAALREANGVLRATGSAVKFLACDAAVHASREVRSVEEMMRSLKGGGGSSFVPAFEALERDRPRPEIIVLCTDGDIDVPRDPPPWARVVWVLVGGRKQAPAAYGTAIVVDDAA